jgi:CheY-like chemotaxis protein
MKGKILVIEDNEQNLYLVRYILEQKNYEVFAAPDGKSGIEMAASLKPDMILLDIQLPVMDGYAVARNLRRNPDLARHTYCCGDILCNARRPGKGNGSRLQRIYRKAD